MIPSWEAFWTLCNSRSLGFGAVGSIPFSEIEAYLHFRRFPSDTEDDVIQHVQLMDIEYMKIINPKPEPEKPEEKKK